MCKDDTAFVTEKFKLILMFENKKLYSVSLFKDFSQDIYLKLFGTLTNDFKLCAMKGNDSSMDLLNLADNVNSRSDFEAQVNNFENSNLTKGQLTYSFVETTPEKMRKFKSVPELIRNLPDSARSAELVVYQEGNESAIAVTFSFPKTLLNKLKEQQKLHHEKF